MVAVDGKRSTIPVDFERRGMRWPKLRATPACVEVWSERRDCKRTRSATKEAELDALCVKLAGGRAMARAQAAAAAAAQLTELETRSCPRF